MSSKVNWQKVRDQFEKEILDKLKGLPRHREVPEQSREFRNIISHELPETAPKSLFRKLIKLLLSGKKVDTQKAREVYLEPELDKEKQTLSKYKVGFNKLKQSARSWVGKNLSEERLQEMWIAHETWLPRRHTIYKKLPTFQKIASDTLIRFHLIKEKYS